MAIVVTLPDLFGSGPAHGQTWLEEPIGPSIVMASENDPWMSAGTAARWAGHWGAELVNLGDAGHINAESGYGPRPQGARILDRLRSLAELGGNVRMKRH